MRVFIADDSAIFRKVLLSSISQCGDAEVVGEAENAMDAIEAINRLRPDIVVLDIRLKAGTGIDILHSIKKTESGTPLTIVLTNFPYDQYRRVSISLGADYFFHKATQFTDFVSVLKGLIPQLNSELEPGKN